MVDDRSPQSRQSKLKALRKALTEGEGSGPPTPFDIEAIIRAAKEEVGPSRRRA